MNEIKLPLIIYELRKKSGYTQQYVSQILNIQRQTYCNYENGLRTPPLEIILELAALYHVSADYLISGKPLDPYQQLPPQEQKLLDLFHALSPDDRKEVLLFAKFRKNIVR